MDRNSFADDIDISVNAVRLVRACGSKHKAPIWQAVAQKVRLVRACGSKQVQFHVHFLKLVVRLVRACGSKPDPQPGSLQCNQGQARKSLWIETARFHDAS